MAMQHPEKCPGCFHEKIEDWSKHPTTRHDGRVLCPKCRSDNLAIFTDHYFCRNCSTEFIIVIDHRKYFPDSCVFPKRLLENFYRYALYTEDMIESENV